MFNYKLSGTQVNYLNIVLMIVSAIAAMIKPFETFLFVYAFLGPLHYLTEISWLHDRKYFTKGRWDFLLLLAAGILITALSMRWIKFENYSVGTAITFFAFGAALIFVIMKNIWARLISFLILFILVAQLYRMQWASDIFGVFLPTLIHVFIFTGLFILVGAMRGRSFSGILSLVVFVVITLGFFYIPLDRSRYEVSKYVYSSYGTMQPATDGKGNYFEMVDGKWKPVTDAENGNVTVYSDGRGFIGLNNSIREIFNLHHFSKPKMDHAAFIKSINDFFYRNPLMLSIMAFIGFAYMYHYLNWFSKTSIIQWHNIPRSRFIAVIVIWLASIGLYAYDYALGLDWLFFLSFTHVLFEFPLNHLTFINIFKEAKGMLTGQPTLVKSK